MKIYQPKDERVLSWDPENMDKYWSQCQQFDQYPACCNLLCENLKSDVNSQLEFKLFSSKTTRII